MKKTLLEQDIRDFVKALVEGAKEPPCECGFGPTVHLEVKRSELLRVQGEAEWIPSKVNDSMLELEPALWYEALVNFIETAATDPLEYRVVYAGRVLVEGKGNQEGERTAGWRERWMAKELL